MAIPVPLRFTFAVAEGMGTCAIRFRSRMENLFPKIFRPYEGPSIKPPRMYEGRQEW